MEFASVRLIYFSPTHTTKKVLTAIAKGISCATVYHTDLTTPKKRSTAERTLHDDLILLGLPVYEEYLPEIVKETLSEFKGHSQPAALVSVYGNIGFGMSLKELVSLTESMRLTPVAAATFIGEHSFSCRVSFPKAAPPCFTYAPAKNAQCNQCRVCAVMCPAGAIHEKDLPIDEAQCLRCFSCVKNCPRSGRDIRFKKKLLVNMMLTRKNSVRQEP